MWRRCRRLLGARGFEPTPQSDRSLPRASRTVRTPEHAPAEGRGRRVCVATYGAQSHRGLSVGRRQSSETTLRQVRPIEGGHVARTRPSMARSILAPGTGTQHRSEFVRARSSCHGLGWCVSGGRDWATRCLIHSESRQILHCVALHGHVEGTSHSTVVLLHRIVPEVGLDSSARASLAKTHADLRGTEATIRQDFRFEESKKRSVA